MKWLLEWKRRRLLSALREEERRALIADLQAAEFEVTVEGAGGGNGTEGDQPAARNNLAMTAADRTPTRFMSRFSPQIRNVEFKREFFAVFGQILVGKINRTTARVILIQKLRQLDYDPGCGFPCERGKPPLVEGPTLDRIDLMIRTEIALTRNERRCREAQDECHKFLFPGWELVLLGCVNPELDSPETRIGEWERRWRAAGDSVKWIGARKPRMMACKDSPIWQALGNGEGGFNDGLKHPFPPFALKSQMDWRAVPRAEWYAGAR